MNLIKEIHSSFSGAEEVLVKEANDILELSQQEGVTEKVDKLSALGFTNSHAVKKLSPEELQKAKTLTEAVEKYKQHFPQNTFITEDKISEICKKYGLVYGEVEFYKGDIPQKNVDEIVEFADAFSKMQDKEVVRKPYQEFEWMTAKRETVRVGDMDDDHLVNTVNFIRRQFNNSRTTSDRVGYLATALGAMILEADFRGLFSDWSLRREDRDEIFVNAFAHTEEKGADKGMLIAADIQSFEPLPKYKYVDRDTYRIKHDTKQELADREQERLRLMREYDPIVLQPVQGGYLVVSAWGDEASDSDVHSPNLN